MVTMHVCKIFKFELQAGSTGFRYSGVIYGNTCCGTDIIVQKCSLPELNEGDFVYFEGKLLQIRDCICTLEPQQEFPHMYIIHYHNTYQIPITNIQS